MAAAFVPSVSAGSDTNETQTVDSAEFIVPVDDSSTQATEATTQATEATTQATEATTQATEATTQTTEATTQATEATTQATEAATQATTESTKSYNQASSLSPAKGFENVETDGGVLFVGTARTPKEGGGISTVKFVYSSSLNLSDKALGLINR